MVTATPSPTTAFPTGRPRGRAARKPRQEGRAALVENTLKDAIRITVEVAPYDAACKRVLMEREILSRVVKECVPEFEDCPLDEVSERYILDDPAAKNDDPTGAGSAVPPLVRGIRNDDNDVADGRATFDLAYSAKAPDSAGGRRMFIDLEPQGNAARLPYPLSHRAVYYCARMISSQHGTVFTNDEYQKLRKVYSVWICMGPPKGTENTITRYRFFKEDVVGFVDDEADYDLMTVVMVRLGEPGTAGYNGILGLLGTLFSKDVSSDEKLRVLAEEYGIEPGTELKEGVAFMGSFGEALFEEGVEKGIAEGEARGMAKMAIASIKGLMASMGLPLDRAMDVLAIPMEDRERYAAVIESATEDPASSEAPGIER